MPLSTTQGGTPTSTRVSKGGIAAAALTTILAGIFAVEGGYVNDPLDRGGATNYGVTEAVARQNGYEGHMRNFPKNCYGKVTVCAEKIYVEKYVEAPGYTPLLSIEPAVAQELVDSAVNMGPARPSAAFQASLNVLCYSGLKTDGRVGPATIKAYQACQPVMGKNALCVAVLQSLDNWQAARYRAIVRAKPSQKRFLNGWLNHRIGNVDRKSCGKGI